MKTMFLFLLLLLNLSVYAQSVALPPLRTPEELLQNASKGRYDYMDSIYEIRNSAMERRSLEDNLKYLATIPDFIVMEVTLQYPEFGISPAKELGDYLTACLAPRMPLEKLTNEEIELFIKLATDETIYTGMGFQAKFLLDPSRTQEGWESLYKKAEVLTTAIEKRVNVPYMLTESALSLQGEILSQYMHDFFPTMELKNFTDKIDRMRSSDGLERILKFASAMWGKMSDPSQKAKLFKVTIAASLKMSTLHDDASLPALASLGEQLVHELKDLLQINQAIDLDDADKASNFFVQKDYQEMIEYLTGLNQGQLLPVHLNVFSLLTTKALLHSTWFFNETLVKLMTFNQMLTLTTIPENMRLPEGLYTSSNQNYLWVFYSSPWRIHAKLLSNWGDLLVSFDTGKYNDKENKISLFQLNKENEIDESASSLAVTGFSTKNNINATVVTEHGNTSFKLTNTYALPSPKGRSLIPGKYVAQVGKNAFVLDLVQSTSSLWRIKLKAGTSSTMNFMTDSACLSTSSSCDFNLVTQAEDQWAYLRVSMSSDTELRLVLVQGLKVTPITMKKN